MNWRKKINALMLFSASVYIMALLGLIQSDQVRELISNVVNFYDEQNIFYVSLIVAVIFSLKQNTQYVFNLTGKLDWFRILGRFGAEFTIMLFGTLASLFAFLGLFTTKPDLIIEIFIFAVTCVALNIFRDRFVNFYDNAFTKKPHRI